MSSPWAPSDLLFLPLHIATAGQSHILIEPQCTNKVVLPVFGCLCCNTHTHRHFALVALRSVSQRLRISNFELAEFHAGATIIMHYYISNIIAILYSLSLPFSFWEIGVLVIEKPHIKYIMRVPCKIDASVVNTGSKYCGFKSYSWWAPTLKKSSSHKRSVK